MDNVTVEIYTGKSKKNGKEYTAVKLTIGSWDKLIFVTPFELQYIKEQLGIAE